MIRAGSTTTGFHGRLAGGLVCLPDLTARVAYPPLDNGPGTRSSAAMNWQNLVLSRAPPALERGPFLRFPILFRVALMPGQDAKRPLAHPTKAAPLRSSLGIDLPRELLIEILAILAYSPGRRGRRLAAALKDRLQLRGPRTPPSSWPPSGWSGLDFDQPELVHFFSRRCHHTLPVLNLQEV